MYFSLWKCNGAPWMLALRDNMTHLEKIEQLIKIFIFKCSGYKVVFIFSHICNFKGDGLHTKKFVSFMAMVYMDHIGIDKIPHFYNRWKGFFLLKNKALNSGQLKMWYIYMVSKWLWSLISFYWWGPLHASCEFYHHEIQTVKELLTHGNCFCRGYSASFIMRCTYFIPTPPFWRKLNRLKPKHFKLKDFLGP